MQKMMQGVVHGRMIELEADPHIKDGSKVEIILRMKKPLSPPPRWQPGSTDSAAGMMAEHWTDEDEQILQEIYEDRKRERPREHSE